MDLGKLVFDLLNEANQAKVKEIRVVDQALREWMEMVTAINRLTRDEILAVKETKEGSQDDKRNLLIHESERDSV